MTAWPVGRECAERHAPVNESGPVPRHLGARARRPRARAGAHGITPSRRGRPHGPLAGPAAAAAMDHDAERLPRGVPWHNGGMDPFEAGDLAGPGTQQAAGLPLRHAGRVIVLDPQDRVLLMRYDDDPPNGRHWCTPGGGLNPGESFAAGARRELAEETGWRDVVLLGEVHRGTRTMEYGGRILRQHERLFLARTGQVRRELGDVAAMHASDGITGWRWWDLAELDTTAEVIWPAGLAALIRAALGRGGGPQPRQ